MEASLRIESASLGAELVAAVSWMRIVADVGAPGSEDAYEGKGVSESVINNPQRNKPVNLDGFKSRGTTKQHVPVGAKKSSPWREGAVFPWLVEAEEVAPEAWTMAPPGAASICRDGLGRGGSLGILRKTPKLGMDFSQTLKAIHVGRWPSTSGSI